MTAQEVSAVKTDPGRAGWLFKTLIWWAFPTLVLATALCIGLDSGHRAAQNTLFSTMESDLIKLQDEADPKEFLQHELDEIYDAVRGLAARPEAVEAVIRGFSGTWPAGSIDIHVFDGSGKLIRQRASPSDMQEVFDRVRIAWTHQFELPASIAQQLCMILPSPEQTMRSMKGRPGRVVTLGSGRTFTWSYYQFQTGITGQRIAGMLAFIHQQKLPKRFALERARHRLSLFNTGIAGDDDAEIEIPGSKTRIPLLELKQKQMNAADDRLFIGDRLVSVKRFNDTTLILASIPDPGFPWLLLLVTAALYAALSIKAISISYQGTFLGRRTAIPVRGKLLLFFGLGFGFPLLLAIGLAQLYLSERREGIWEDQRQESFRQLSAIDSQFAPFLTRRRLFYGRLCRQTEQHMGSSLPDLKPFDDLYSDYRFDSMQVIASSGKPLLISRMILAELRQCLSLPRPERIRRFESYIERGLIPNPMEVDAINKGPLAKDLRSTEGGRFESMVSRVAVQAGKIAMDQYDTDHGLSSQRQTSNADMVVESVIEDDAKPLMQGARTSIGKMISLSSGSSIAMVYLDILAGPAGNAWYSVFIFNNLITLEVDYLAKLFERAETGGFQPDPSSALHVRAVSWHHMSRNFPDQNGYRTFSKILDRLDRAPDALSLTMDIDGAPHLVCALPGSGLRHYALLGTVPIADLDRRYAEVAMRVRGSVVALALFGLAVFAALRRRLIAPIAAVTEGLEAMKRGELDRPIPVTGQDELGQMCAAINQAMERLREMELARTIQADLLPQNRLDLDMFVLQGRNRMSQAVGGDYFDFIPLHRGLTAVILGDVSGHGVSAALVTAMAKAAFTILCPRYPDQPEEVLTRLNRLLLSLLNRSKIMSCFLGILDSQSCRLMAANAGQSYPILLTEDGRAEMVQMPSQPLGTRVKAVFKRLDIDLRHAGLLLYSDGMVEAMSSDQKMFTYDGLLKTASTIWNDKRKSASEADLLNPLFERLEAHTGTDSFTDDVTLVIIRPRT